MRLLEILPNGELRLTEKLLDDTIPQYAILSHTWGKESEEVTFEDTVAGLGQGKAGYEKIKFCADQAAIDGLRYFWVDSCCIKKSSDAELSESLNSMFRWYQRAKKCYVYLKDVSTTKRKRGDEKAQNTWEQAFRESKWFTRGWTLQELLAPASLQFFSEGAGRLGDKQSLEQQIHEITGIPILALRGSTLSQFSAEQKFGWAKNRKTTREEDWAYSLLGIFEISMPVVYGEGRTNAIRRLEKEINDTSKAKQCLRDLRTTDPRADKVRIEETKGGLIPDSCRWILENDEFKQWRHGQQSHLLWIKGDPGKGKTMLLCGIINELQKSAAETHLLSFFYCQATDSRINNATGVLRGLLYLLIDQQPSLISHIQKQHDLAGETLFKDANAWVALSDIFTNVLQDPSLKSTYLIIDALDECSVGLPKLLEFITQKSSISPYVKWLVSSRNWPLIEEQLDKTRSKVRLCLELNAESVSVAVSIYILHKVRRLAQEKKYDNKTRDAVLDYLSLNANNTFLWVALVYQNLQKVKPWNVLTKLNEFPSGLNSLYGRMVEQIGNSDDADLCKRILALIALVYRPIALKELTSLVDMPETISQNLEWLAEIIGLCGSFLTIREDIVYFVHQSAKDYLLAEASDKIFLSGKGEIHREIFSRSLKVMSRILRRDIYDLCTPGHPIEQVKPPDPDPLETSRYSYVYWVDHLCDWNFDYHADQRAEPQDGGIVDVFIRNKFLYWLEALSLCRSMSEGVVSMAKLEALIQAKAGARELRRLVKDARRFIMSHKPAIENSPLQAYASALLFSPTRSLIKNLFRHEEPKWITIQPTMRDEWSACVQTLEGHGDDVKSVAFSHNSSWLASASRDCTVKIWDASSGACLQTLKGHSRGVNSVAFSHNSSRLASASGDRTVKIWDANSGACLQTLKGHSVEVNSVAFSHNSSWLASASRDFTVKIWDAGSGICLQTLKGCNEWVNSVAFSHNSSQLASASNDSTVKIWDTSSGACLQTLEGHSNWVNSVAFSHDSTRLASASSDTTAKIWDAGSGSCIQTLKGHRYVVNSITFLHDSNRLASASSDFTVKIWNANNGACLQTLEGHGYTVKSVAFSRDSTWLASASMDKTIKIWDTNSSVCNQTLESHRSWVSSLAFSHDSTLLASASADFTVKIWDTSSGACLQTLEGHSDCVRLVAFSHNSKQLASSSDDETVKTWDTSSGVCLQTLEGQRHSTGSIAFSHNLTQLASVLKDYTIKIWDTNSGICLQTLKGHSKWVNSVAFSHNSSQLVSASSDTTAKIWDISSGTCIQTFVTHSDQVRSVAFSPDSTRLALALGDKTVRVWDASSGAWLQTIEVGKTLDFMSFDATGLHIHTEIGTIAIHAPSASLATLMESQAVIYQGPGLSLNGEWITYNSENVLRLPSEYWRSCSAVSATTVAIAAGYGKVRMCSFNIENS